MDKVVVITGASSGIGAALAKHLGQRGARLALAARRKAELEVVAVESGGALAVITDVTVRADVERLKDAALKQFGRIDAWVNNAGRGITRAVAELTDDDLDSMWRDNVKSAIYGVQAVLPHFKARNQGQILNISSGLARVPLAPRRSAYAAAKSALNMLSACLRMELQQSHPGIHVTVVMPGVVATDFGLRAVGGGPDSRKLPNAQSVDEVAEIIIKAIEDPCPEVFTTPFVQEMVQRYARTPAEVEAELVARMAGP